MADVAQILIEIAKKRGYEDGETSDAIEKRGPIKMEERTIQVMNNSLVFILYAFTTRLIDKISAQLAHC